MSPIRVRPTPLTEKYLLSHWYSWAELKEIADLLLLSDWGFNHTSRRFEADMEAKVQLGKNVEYIPVIQDL